MNQQEMTRVFDYVKSNINYLDNGCNYDYVIDFENGLNFSIDDLAALWKIYSILENALIDYIESADLDDVTNYEKIAEEFPDLVTNQYLKYNQAVLIDFKDFALLKAKKVAERR